MCDLCGQAHCDMVKAGTLTVCASKRYCMLYMLRNATALQVARMHRMALESALTSTETPQEQLAS
jgi:hypothetical protein